MIVALLFVFLAGTVPLIALSRSASSIPFAGAGVLVLAATGASLATAVGTSVVRVTFVLIVVANLGAIAMIIRRRVSLRQLWVRRTWLGDLGLATWFMIPSLLLLLLFPPAPLGWDARSIWWFHASWFRSGGQVAQDSLGNSLLSFSQPDYPAGNPAAIATLWRLTGSVENLELAQALTSVMSGLAVASLGLVLVHRHRSLASIGAATVLVAAASNFGQGLAAAGYVDVLCAALLVTALAAHLCLNDARLALTLGSVALAGASVTKNEGLAFGFIVLIAAIAATRHGRIRVAASGALALVPALSWSLVVRVHLAEPIEDQAPLSSDPQLWERLRVSVPAVFREISPVVWPTLLVCLLLAVAIALGRQHGSSLPWSSLVPACTLLAVGIAGAFGASMAYAVGPYELSWWFATSLERVAATPELFALASLVTMVPVATELWRHSTPESEGEIATDSHVRGLASLTDDPIATTVSVDDSRI